MKKLLALLLVLLMFGLSACGSPAANAPDTDTDSQETVEVKAENVPVGLVVNEDGYYSLYADVSAMMQDGEMTSLEITNTVLLAFQVSSLYGGGVYPLPLEDGEYIIDALTEISAQLREKGEADMAEQLEYVLKLVIESGPLTQAST